MRSLVFAHSPDPDDVFMYYGFETGAVAMPDVTLTPKRIDIQTLNLEARKKTYPFTAISARAYADVANGYWLCSVGASVGRNYGPVLVKRTNTTDNKLSLSPWREGALAPRSLGEGGVRGENILIAVPGLETTATLILQLWLNSNPSPLEGEGGLAGWGANVELIPYPFDQILDVVKRGECDWGLIIHEGQLLYQELGFERIWDAGTWWESETHAPLPLGLVAIRKDVGEETARAFTQAFRQSIQYALNHFKEAFEYAKPYGRDMTTETGKKFIEMYVNQDSIDSRKALETSLVELYNRGEETGLLKKPNLVWM